MFEDNRVSAALVLDKLYRNLGYTTLQLKSILSEHMEPKRSEILDEIRLRLHSVPEISSEEIKYIMNEINPYGYEEVGADTSRDYKKNKPKKVEKSFKKRGRTPKEMKSSGDYSNKKKLNDYKKC